MILKFVVQDFQQLFIVSTVLNAPDYSTFQLLSALSNKLKMSDEPLPQDLTEGVDPDEWVSILFKREVCAALKLVMLQHIRSFTGAAYRIRCRIVIYSLFIFFFM